MISRECAQECLARLRALLISANKYPLSPQQRHLAQEIEREIAVRLAELPSDIVAEEVCRRYRPRQHDLTDIAKLAAQIEGERADLSADAAETQPTHLYAGEVQRVWGKGELRRAIWGDKSPDWLKQLEPDDPDDPDDP